MWNLLGLGIKHLSIALASGFFLIISLIGNNYFTIMWWFLPYINMNQPQLYTCPPNPETLSHLPPHPIPLGCPRAPALGALLHAWNLHCSSILHIAMYMFQRYSLKSSHPCLLLPSGKVCSLRLSLLCCPACPEVATIFPNSIICVIIYSICPFLYDLPHSV